MCLTNFTELILVESTDEEDQVSADELCELVGADVVVGPVPEPVVG